MKLVVDIVTPEAEAASLEAVQVIVPSTMGEMGILANHVPTISSLKPGIVSIYANDDNVVSHKYIVAGGFVEITPDRCTILATEAFDSTKIDKSDAESRLEAANDLLEKAETDLEKSNAESAKEFAELLLESN